MHINLIVAMDKKGCIGKQGRLPWEMIPADMKHFRDVTRQHFVVMGRTTWESIGSTPLKNRFNIILSRNKDFKVNGVPVFNSVAEVLLFFSEMDQSIEGEVFVIGGAEIYEAFLPYARRIYVTEVDGEFGGDTFFPKHDTKEWQVVGSQTYRRGPFSPYNLEFTLIDRVSNFVSL
ncbi:MAG: dihydrofolate reductase [Candidatus Paceibacterota bacterium]|jgi:dihydrofolate reductase